MRNLAATLAVGYLLLAGPPASHAADDIAEVRASLDRQYGKVIPGKHIDHVEYLRIAAYIAEGGPAGLVAYIEELAVEIAKDLGQKVGIDTLRGLLSGRLKETVVGGKAVYGFIATYKHWVNIKYPRIDRFRVSEGEYKRTLPNTHQFYLAIGKRGKDDPNTPPPPPVPAGKYALKTWTDKWVSANNIKPWEIHQKEWIGPGESFELHHVNGNVYTIKAWTNKWWSANNVKPWEIHQVDQPREAERFWVDKLPDGRISIRTWTGKYASANNAPPFQVHQMDARGPAEAFELERLEDLDLTAKYAIQTWTGKYVSANNADPWQLHQVDNLGPGEVFRLEAAAGGKVAIKTWSERSWVSAENDGKFKLHQVEKQGEGERFELQSLGRGLYSIKTWTDKYVSANNAPPWQIHQQPHRREAEAFQLIKLP
ncbi:hypothetical protein J0H58_18920 [bacterium]|nr:hypothetical protein [bacterium]